MDLSQFQANYSPYNFGEVAPKKKKGGRGGSATSFISEGGALGGAATGAAVGSVVPVLGTAIGAGIGGLIGGFGGRILENKVRDDRYGLKDAALEGAISGVAGGGLKALKVGVNAAKATKGGVGLADALLEANAKAGTNNALTKAGTKVGKVSDELFIKNFKLNPSQLQNYKNKFGEDAAVAIKKYGFTNADDIASKGVQPLQQQFDAAITNIPAVPKTSVLASLKKQYDPLVNSAVKDKQAIGAQLREQADEIAAKYGDNVPAGDINKLRQEFDSLVNYAEKSTNPARHTVNKRAADALREALQTTADKAGIKTEGGLSFKELGKEISKLRKLSDYAEKQSQLGRGSNPLGISNLLGGAVGGGAGGPVGAAAGIVGSTVVNSTPGRRALAKGADALSSGLTKAGQAGGSLPGQIAGASSRIGAAGAAGAGFGTMTQPPATLEDALVNHSENTSASMPANTTSPNPMSADANMSQLYQNSQQNTSPYSRENLVADIQRDPKNAEKYIAQYESLDKIFAPASGQKLNATQIQQANTATSGIDSLNTIAQLLQENPNAARMAALPGGSLTQKVTGTGSYSAAVSNAVDAIGRLRSGGAINADEEKRFKSFLPAAFDDPETVQYKLQALNNIFQRFASPQSAGPATLEDAIMSQGGR